MAAILSRALIVDPLSRLETATCRQAKANLKEMEIVWRAQTGRAFAQAIRYVGWTQKEAAAALGRDQAQIARWVSGGEGVQVAAVFAVDDLRVPFVIALASLSHDIEITTQLAIRRRA